MREIILEKLRKIEERENVRVLLAVESGSRAWGFASPDSDYDVRFIYVRPEQDYLKLEAVSDVIEIPIDKVLDINGWDIQKTLRLLYKSNPTLFEWFQSPIVYLETEFAYEFRALMNKYFSSKRSLYHYINMAKRHYKEFLMEDMVKAKKYFYVLRPVLACKWILDKQTPPPMLFEELAKAELPNELNSDIEKLLDLKMNSPEVKMIPRIDRVNSYLEASIDEILKIISAMDDDRDADWSELNELFLRTVTL